MCSKTGYTKQRQKWSKGVNSRRNDPSSERSVRLELRTSKSSERGWISAGFVTWLVRWRLDIFRFQNIQNFQKSEASYLIKLHYK
jgi:hypothetical protein